MVSTVANTESNGSVGDSCHACYKHSCEPTKVTITAKKPDRKYTLDLSKPHPKGRPDYVLRVLARSDKPRIIDVTLKGDCKHGHSGSSPVSQDYDKKRRRNNDSLCPTALIDAHGIDANQPSPLKVALYPPTVDADSKGFKKFLEKYLIPINLNNANSYPIRTSTCTGIGKQSAKVDVFQEASWTGRLSLGYEQPEENQIRVGTKNRIVEQGNYKLSGELNVDVNTESWKIGGEWSSQKDRPFDTINKLLKKIIPFFSDLDTSQSREVKKEGSTDFRIDWPQISIGGGVKVIEVENKPVLDTQGEIDLQLNPLFGATLKVDLLNWLIRVTGHVYSNLLIKIRTKAEKGYESETAMGKAIIGIDLTVIGRIGGKLHWDKAIGKQWIPDNSEIKADLELGLEGKIKVETRFLVMKYTFGADFYLGSDESPSGKVGCFGSVAAIMKHDQPSLNGKIQFTGAAIYYSYYSEVGIESIDSNKTGDHSNKRNENSSKGGKNNELTKILNKKNKESNKVVTLMEPFLWPNKEVILNSKTI
jgi:hypothetical protein